MQLMEVNLSFNFIISLIIVVGAINAYSEHVFNNAVVKLSNCEIRDGSK